MLSEIAAIKILFNGIHAKQTLQTLTPLLRFIVYFVPNVLLGASRQANAIRRSFA
jgi:hypothetical protein